ncbi:TolC family protein [Massilia endophytica]|uniref:TolC family protein n=1 Tax=Massilia endophytica TaxID=2899220 RepID=UPI001E298D22|nr:TolC family protein [Massilia endophytica]UGQ48045.1 TolC family protein [Massilia endophytica]
MQRSLFTLLLAASPALWAQDLLLRDAVALALARSPDISLQRSTQQAAEGVARSSNAPFDLVQTAALGGTRDERPLRADERARYLSAGPDQLIDGSTTSLGASRQFANGLQLSGLYAVTRADDNVQGAQNIPRQTSDRLTFTLRVPLQKNPGKDAAAARNAATLDAAAAARETEQAVARTVLAVVQAYWDWAARQSAADVAAAAETRTRQLRRETEKLVEADELPPADLNLLTAAVTEREAARIGAEQRARDGRFALARLYGMDAGETAALAPPAQRLPEHAGSDSMAALGAQALQRRADVAALRLREEAMDTRLKAARNSDKPALDLDVSAYYAGLREGARTAAAAFDPTSRHSGPGIAAKLSLQWPVQNSANSGALQVAAANADSARLRRVTLEQSVTASMESAYQAYNAYAAQLRASELTIARYRAALQDTSTRRQLGSATLIDVLNVEDRLNNALLARLQFQQGYATARAQILYETGRLLRTGPDGTLSVALDELLP